MPSIYSETKRLLEALQELGVWSGVKDKLKSEIASELSNVSTPEEAFRSATRFQMIDDVFYRIEAVMQTTQEGTKP